MSKKSGLLGTNAWLEFVGSVVLLLSALGIWFWYDQRALQVPQDVALLQPTKKPVPKPQAEPQTTLKTEQLVQSEQPTTQAQPETPAEVQDVAPTQSAIPLAGNAPRFDEVRRESDGLTVIAGRAAPGSKVRVLLDGKEVASAEADSRGSFAAIARADPDGQGHVLTLSTQDGETEITSDDEILLAPMAPRVAIAEPAPTAPTAPAQRPETTPENTGAEASTSAAASDQTLPRVTDGEPDPTTPAESTPESDTPQVAEAPPTQQTGQVALLKADATGVELIQAPAAAPQVMSSVALDTISYSDAGNVQLSGRAQEGSAEVRVYLDNAPLANLAVDGSGRWRGDLPEVDEGIYTLRVDEVDAEGAVTSRVETPFKRESPQVLAQAAAGVSGPMKAITVQKGATLWAIARDRYGDGTLYVRVFEANSETIRDPDLIYPGQVFDLPN